MKSPLFKSAFVDLMGSMLRMGQTTSSLSSSSVVSPPTLPPRDGKLRSLLLEEEAEEGEEGEGEGEEEEEEEGEGERDMDGDGDGDGGRERKGKGKGKGRGGEESSRYADMDQDLTLELPLECMAWIFQKLSPLDRSSCSLVCKRWHFSEAKSRDRLSLKAESSLEQHADTIFSRYEFITCLSLKCSRKDTSIDDTTLVLIGKGCKHLTKLKLKSCKVISDEGLGEFAKVRGRSLKKFSCGSCGFTSKGLNLFLENCSSLEDLSIKRLRRLRDNPEAILPGQSKLKRLCLKEIMNAHLFGTLLAGSKSIHTLILARNPGMWDQFFNLVNEHLTELVELWLDNLSMGDVALKAIANCSKLEILHVAKLTDCTDAGYSAIANGCPRIKKLYIDDRRNKPIGDKGLLTIGKNCTKMQELVLIGVNVTSESLRLIASNCAGLERMALCSSEGIGDTELSCIAEKFMSLKKLCIKNCPITDVGMEVLVRGCPSLTKVKVKKCKDITMNSAIQLRVNRPDLVVTLDTPVAPIPEEEEEEENFESPRAGEAPRNMFFRNRAALTKNRLALAAGNFLRQAKFIVHF